MWGRPALALLTFLPLVHSPALAQNPRSGISVGGLAYEVVGQGDPVVLIHGFGLDRRAWDPQLPALTAQFRVIRYDLRGHGRTLASVAEPYTHQDDLAQLLFELGVERAAIVGHSLGGRVALDFALSYPGQVTRLVVVGPGLSGYVPRQRPVGFDSVGAALRAGDARRAASFYAETPLMAIPNDSAMHRFMRGIVMDNFAVWGIRTNTERPLNPPAISRLASVAVPTLVIVGENDSGDILTIADTVAAGVHGARKVVVPAAGHMISLAAAKRFTELVVGFLRGR
ncbi:MAG: hypothetical protein A2W29_05215 [Gemmatimonadetes bacterium RBG_16_66_8]|nr:MAG: hypothetical protein A2W29_05215 [Gemmatimonadetes bacterium RBG_16_66_8]